MGEHRRHRPAILQDGAHGGTDPNSLVLVARIVLATRRLDEAQLPPELFMELLHASPLPPRMCVWRFTLNLWSNTLG